MAVVQFSKMHGLGNDFVVFDAISQAVVLTPALVRFIADRHFGIGCDQVLVVERPTVSGAQFRYRIYNADGGEVEQCGNGARCFARFVRDRGLTSRDVIAVQTVSGLIHLAVGGDGQITVDMGRPRLEPAEVPFVAERRSASYALDLAGGEVLVIGAVSMGNPHAVLRVADVQTTRVADLGPELEKHPRFPNRANIGFMEVVDRGHLRLRVHERGAGETLACGTGACAAVVVARDQGLVGDQVSVDLPGGRLAIRWEGGESAVWMTGPATHVFDGQIDL
jgi:diaminopimelate epimerase